MDDRGYWRWHNSVGDISLSWGVLTVCLFCIVFQIFNVDVFVLDVWVRRHSRSLEMTPFADRIRLPL